MIVRLKVNGSPVEADVEPRELLSDFLRGMGLKSVHVGCGTGHCGACTVLVDGRAVKSCMMLAAQADGRSITTLEGLSPPAQGGLHPIQEAFVEEHAVQCGFCTPGMIMTAAWLLADNPHPTEEDVREAISGNLCRCTGYDSIVRAISRAAESMAVEAQASAQG